MNAKTTMGTQSNRLAVGWIVLHCISRSAHSFNLQVPPVRNSIYEPRARTFCRRDFLSLLVVGTSCPSSIAKAAYEDSNITLRLETPDDKAGIALYDVTIGTPPRTVPAIKRLVDNTRRNAQLQPGLVLKGYPNSLAVLDRIRQGPYPIQLEFYNLDASKGELGEGLTAEDALNVAQQQASQPRSADHQSSVEDNNSYVRRLVQAAPDCRIRSRRDDVLEINYTARIGSLQGVIYDASEFRGTGRPYQMVLGSGDMIAGVDQGLVNMCPGEMRQIEIPPSLAYGAKGNKLFRIPPNARLIWEIELVSVNSMRQQQKDDSDDT
jgi:FK506-binding protein 2